MAATSSAFDDAGPSTRLPSLSAGAAAPTFSPDGLYFLGPRYDANWSLPVQTPTFDWLP